MLVVNPFFFLVDNIQKSRETRGHRVQSLAVKAFKPELGCAREHTVRDIGLKARPVSCNHVLVRPNVRLGLNH